MLFFIYACLKIKAAHALYFRLCILRLIRALIEKLCNSLTAMIIRFMQKINFFNCLVMSAKARQVFDP